MKVAFQKRRVIAALAIAAAMLGHANTPFAAESRPVDCELTVRGTTYIRGICQFRPTGGGGFQISGDDYFAYVNVTGRGVAEASWNEHPESTHAQAPLGVVTRKGACWTGANATICARDLSPEKARAVTAAQPDGLSLFPNLPGASSACIGAEGKLEPGSALVLHNCRLPADHIFVRRGDGSLGIAKRPDLCLAVEAPGMSKPPQLIVDVCRPDLPRWTTAANTTQDAVVRSSDGMCLTIPKASDPNARFPFFVGVAPCRSGAGALTFFLTKG
ncbi:MAG: hypothetical protein AB7V13_12240 [Pseudorhodoplanes sp.]|uniref:hypothetical protein n=1 Tax=Pseudorhodoplanes sp. TaxID=1934341 RepID=UPI003D152298